MINKLSQRHSCENVENYAKYVVKCPTCGTILNFGKDDVYKDEKFAMENDVKYVITIIGGPYNK